MFESLSQQSNDVVWVLTYLNTDCQFSKLVFNLRQALTQSLLGLQAEPQAENISTGTQEAHKKPVAAHENQQEQDDKKRFVAGVHHVVEHMCSYLGEIRWSEHVRPRMGDMNEQGEPFIVQNDEASQIVQMKQWINALYHLEQGLRVIESEELTPHLQRYTAAKNNVFLGLSLAWHAKELHTFYDKIITSLYRSFYLITHIELDLNEIFENEFKMISTLWQHWISSPQTTPQTKDVLNLSEKIGFFLGLLLDQLRPEELGGVNYSLVTRTAAMLPELKRYFEQMPFAQQKQDLVALSKRFLGDFGIDDRGFIHDSIELIYHGLASNLEQEERLGELPALDDGPAKRFFKMLFTEQKKQEKNLDDLQETALKLKHALSDLRDGEILTIINYIYIARHGWDLACAIQEESTALKKEVQALITEGIVYVRDHQLPKCLAFVDKIEEVLMFEPGFFAQPFMMWLNSSYRALASQLPIEHVGSIIAPAFLLERIRLAEKRHQKIVDQQQRVKHVLKPAFSRLTAYSRFMDAGYAGTVGVANTGALTTEWSKLYRPLQKYLEALDPTKSNYLLQCCRSGDWNFIRCEGFFDRFEAQLRSLEITHALSMKLNMSMIQGALRTLAKTQLSKELQGLEASGVFLVPVRSEQVIFENKFAEYLEVASSKDDLKFANQRCLSRYLITNISDKAPVRQVSAFLKRQREVVTANLDSEASTTSALNLHRMITILDCLEQSCSALESLCDTHLRVTFVMQTIILFKTWVFASAVLTPAFMEAKEVCQRELNSISDWIIKQSRYYNPAYRETKAWRVNGFFHVMNALAIFPMHMKALHAKQDELLEKNVLVSHEKALKASIYFSKVMEASDSWIGLVLEYTAIWNLFANVKRMGRHCLDETYHFSIKNGLNDLNERLFFSLLHKIDLYEMKCGLKPGVLSDIFEYGMDTFFRGMLEPLGLPSSHYIALVSNRASYDKRFCFLPAGAVSHQAHFRSKYSDAFFEQRATEGRKHCIQRAMKHEMKRLHDTRTGLQHTSNEMYLNAFEVFARPDIDALVNGNGCIEEQVCDLLKIKMQAFQALHDEDYRRLDTILDVLAALKKYLAVPADASLFETKDTHRRKLRKVQYLEKIAQDIEFLPHERIEKMRRVMQKNNFQATMLAYARPDWFTYHAFERCVLWLLECVGLYTPDCRTNYNNLVRSIHPETPYNPSPLIKLGLFDTPVSSYERQEDKAVYDKLDVTWYDDLEESLASSQEHP